MTKVNKNINPKRHHRIPKQGDFYLNKNTDDIYILARVDQGEYNLVGLDDGNRWTEHFRLHEADKVLNGFCYIDEVNIDVK